ncbi:hypothetical protein GCM10014719_54830 [Planomonospora parontospora subsp. antibiotica]|nr:hypothetical protein GCM10014719_54830 [Planomonospora parontospora subsp. antibiotica]GII19399.1 hypothetical protein Ppa05_61250 [Planomonospora parontospora subsp. antibiotica]
MTGTERCRAARLPSALDGVQPSGAVTWPAKHTEPVPPVFVQQARRSCAAAAEKPRRAGAALEAEAADAGRGSAASQLPQSCLSRAMTIWLILPPDRTKM